MGRVVKAELNSHQPQHAAFGVPYKHLIFWYHLIITAIWIRGSRQELVWLTQSCSRWHWFCTGASSGLITISPSITNARDNVWGLNTALWWFHPELATATQERRSKLHRNFHFGIFSHKALLFYAAQLCTQMPSIYNFQWKVNEMASLLSCQKYNWNANLKTFSK